MFKSNSSKNIHLLWPEFSAVMDGYVLAKAKDWDFGAKCAKRWGQDRVLASTVTVFYIARSAGRNLFVLNTIVAVFAVLYVYQGQS